MDWASMVMQMYKMWAQHRGYRVTVVDVMPGEMAGIKVQFHHPLSDCNIFTVSLFFVMNFISICLSVIAYVCLVIKDDLSYEAAECLHFFLVV